MEIIIPTCGREPRLAATLSSLLLQTDETQDAITLLCNNGFRPGEGSTVLKILRSFERVGWKTDIAYTQRTSISEIKLQALKMAEGDFVTLIDEDVLFIRPRTLWKLKHALKVYEADAASPLGFEVDNDRPILNEFSHLYNEVEPSSDGISEGRIALGLCVMLTKRGREIAMKYWCEDLPYMEDQVMIHFVKAHSNYVICHSNPVVHLSAKEDRAYVFDDHEVVEYLERRVLFDREYLPLLDLRRRGLDGASFRKPLAFRSGASRSRGLDSVA